MPREAPAAFFSYSREDSAFALRLAQDLKAAGANVWIDQVDIEPGQEWDSAIEAAVTQSPRMLLILSPSSVKSRNVRNEISFALDENKTIIPVLYQDCTVPLQLRRVQYIDLRTDYSRGLNVLLRTLGVEQRGPVGAKPAIVEPSAIKVDQELKQGVPERLEQEHKRAAEQAKVEDEGRKVAERIRLEEERKRSAEQDRLEQERKQAARLARPEEEPGKVEEQALGGQAIEETQRKAAAKQAQAKAETYDSTEVEGKEGEQVEEAGWNAEAEHKAREEAERARRKAEETRRRKRSDRAKRNKRKSSHNPIADVFSRRVIDEQRREEVGPRVAHEATDDEIADEEEMTDLIESEVKGVMNHAPTLKEEELDQRADRILNIVAYLMIVGWVFLIGAFHSECIREALQGIAKGSVVGLIGCITSLWYIHLLGLIGVALLVGGRMQERK